MRRKIGYMLLFLVVGVGLWWGGSRYNQAAKLRPVVGALTETNLDPAEYQAGSFVLRWHNDEGGYLSLHHSQNPGRTLWASLPGRAFVGVGEAIDQVSETRAMFTVDEELVHTCTEQKIEQIRASNNVVMVQGILYCDSAIEPAAYTLIFQPIGDKQIKFTLTSPYGNRRYLTYASTAEERFYGFGEQFSMVNLKGQRVPIIVTEQGLGRGAQPITAGADLQAGAGGNALTSYAPVPFYLTNYLHALFLENSEYSVFDLRQPEQVQVQTWHSTMTGRVIYAESPAEIISEYTTYSGRMRPLPNWVTSGAIVGMQGGTDKVRTVWGQLQEHNTPLAAFWLQDWVGQRTTTFGKQLWWNWEHDRDHYPLWRPLLEDLEAKNVRLMTYINPFLVDVSEKENARRNLLLEAQEKGYLVKKEGGEDYLLLQTSFTAGLIDLTNPEAREWLKQVLRDQLLTTGVSGWMSDFGEGLPYDAVLFDGTPAASYHNRYPEEWAKLNRELIDELPNGDEYVFFSRSGFTQSPRYVTLFWLGDQMVSWDEHDGLKTAVTGLLSSGFTGYAFNHSDIGGYTTITHFVANYHRSEELLLRWMELNAFTTIFRSHEGNQPDNNVQIYSNENTLAHFARMAKVYKAWEFYRQRLVQEAADTGLPVVRHPFIHYPQDAAVWDLQYQFMVGSEFMVAPVLDEGAAEVEIYLPAGEWVNVWTGETVAGGQTLTVAAPLGQPAVFYPAGSSVGVEFGRNLEAAGLRP